MNNPTQTTSTDNAATGNVGNVNPSAGAMSRSPADSGNKPYTGNDAVSDGIAQALNAQAIDPSLLNLAANPSPNPFHAANLFPPDRVTGHQQGSTGNSLDEGIRMEMKALMDFVRSMRERDNHAYQNVLNQMLVLERNTERQFQQFRQSLTEVANRPVGAQMGQPMPYGNPQPFQQPWGQPGTMPQHPQMPQMSFNDWTPPRNGMRAGMPPTNDFGNWTTRDPSSNAQTPMEKLMTGTSSGETRDEFSSRMRGLADRATIKQAVDYFDQLAGVMEENDPLIRLTASTDPQHPEIVSITMSSKPYSQESIDVLWGHILSTASRFSSEKLTAYAQDETNPVYVYFRGNVYYSMTFMENEDGTYSLKVIPVVEAKDLVGRKMMVNLMGDTVEGKFISHEVLNIMASCTDFPR